MIGKTSESIFGFCSALPRPWPNLNMNFIFLKFWTVFRFLLNVLYVSAYGFSWWIRGQFKLLFPQTYSDDTIQGKIVSRYFRNVFKLIRIRSCLFWEFMAWTMKGFVSFWANLGQKPANDLSGPSKFGHSTHIQFQSGFKNDSFQDQY